MNSNNNPVNVVPKKKRVYKKKNVVSNITTSNENGLEPSVNNITNKKKTVPVIDSYTKNVLQEQFYLHKDYVSKRKESATRLGISFRHSGIPEDISENMIKYIIHRNGDVSSKWNCKGDLLSVKEGIQECKCFTSDGPCSFTPSSEWDVIYFLDARKWLNDKFILYKISLKMSSEEWKKIKVSKLQTIDDQCKQGRRPRITWNSLQPQISEFCENIFEGSFSDIFKEEIVVA